MTTRERRRIGSWLMLLSGFILGLLIVTYPARAAAPAADLVQNP